MIKNGHPREHPSLPALKFLQPKKQITIYSLHNWQGRVTYVESQLQHDFFKPLHIGKVEITNLQERTRQKLTLSEANYMYTENSTS